MWISTARNPLGVDFRHVIGRNVIRIKVVVEDVLRVQPAGVICCRQEPGILATTDPIDGDILPGRDLDAAQGERLQAAPRNDRHDRV